MPPAIPEPDYEPETTKTLERNTIKKKKSVSFVEDISKKEEQSVKKVPKKPPESILKDTTAQSTLSVAAPINTHCQHGKPIIRPALVGDKYMQPIERIPRLKVAPNNNNNMDSKLKNTHFHKDMIFQSKNYTFFSMFQVIVSHSKLLKRLLK